MRCGIVLAVVMVMGCGLGARAAETVADRKIHELGANAPEAKVEQVYAQALDGIVTPLGGEDLKLRQEAQETLENMANNAAAPGREGQRAALCKAMAGRIGPETTFEARYWMIREMETVGKGEVVEVLNSLLNDPDGQVRQRAECALEANSTPQAARKLAQWRQAARHPDDRMRPPVEPDRVAALRELVDRKDPSSAAAIGEALVLDDPKLQLHAARIAGELGADVASKIIQANWDKLSSSAKAVLIYAVSEDQGDLSRRIVLDAALNDDETIRAAAIEGLGRIGDVGAVAILLHNAAEEAGSLQAAARESLGLLNAAGVDGALISDLPAASATKRAEIARALGVRRSPEALPVLLELARTDPDHEVRVQALDALSTAGTPAQIDSLIVLLGSPKSEEDAPTIESAIGAVIYRIREPDQKARPLLAALEKYPQARLALLRLLGRTGSADALMELRKALGSGDREVRVAAVRAMSEWPNDGVAGDLLEFARGTSDLTEKVLALRGYLRALSIPNDRSEEELVKLYAAALPLARVEEKKAILGGLANHPTVDALKLVAPMLDEKDVQNEAINAAVKIARGVGKQDAALVRTAMHKVENSADLERTRQSAREILRALDEP